MIKCARCGKILDLPENVVTMRFSHFCVECSHKMVEGNEEIL
jgi:DNA-directed RNA polymerase subunit RPC12/RpoP